MNFLQTIYNVWLYRPYDRLSCMMPVMQRSAIGMVELNLSYAYYLLKIADFADTVFFVLRKRHNQVSFLHVYHHIMMAVFVFVYLRYLPGGHGTILALLNLTVHAVMYFYYFISALRPELKQSLWWKKYITQAQIVQFLLLFLHFAHALFDMKCEYPKVGLAFPVIQAIIMLVLFSDFYYKVYLRPNKEKLVPQTNVERDCEHKKEDFSAEPLAEAESEESTN